MQRIPSHLPGVLAWTEDFLCLDQSAPSITSSSTNTPTSPLIENSVVPTSSSVHVPIRRSSRITHKPTWLADYVSNSATTNISLSSQYQNYFSALAANSDPVHFSVATQDQNWCVATNKELRTLEDNDT